MFQAVLRTLKKHAVMLTALLVSVFYLCSCEQPVRIDPDAHIFFALDGNGNLVCSQFSPDAEKQPDYRILLEPPEILSEPENFEIIGVIPEGETALLLVTRKHGLLATENLGKTWERRDVGLPPEVIWPFENHGFTKPVIGVSVARDKKRIALLFPEMLYLSHDGGKTFVRAPLGGGTTGLEFLCVAWHPDDEKLILIGTALPGRKANSGLLYSLDGGVTAAGIDSGLPGEPNYAPNYMEEIRAVCWGPDKDTFYVGLGNGNGVFSGSISARTMKKMDEMDGFYTYPDGDYYRVDSLNYYNGALYITTNRAWKKLIVMEEPKNTDEPQALFQQAFRFSDDVIAAWTASGSTLTFAKAHTPRRSAPVDPRVMGKKGLYISYSFTQGANYDKLVAMLRQLKLNAVIINMKNDSGDILLDSTDTADPLFRKTGALGYYVKLKETFAKLKKDGIYVIGRVVVFKDDYLYNYDNFKYAIKLDNGAPLPKGPEKWVDPYCEDVWDYNIAAARAIVETGVDEIQFDYIRFPDLKSDYAQRARYAYKKENQLMREALVSFLKKAKSRLSVPVSVDLFGFQAVYKYGLWIGQDITEMSAWVDAVSPMFYPSHYTGQYAYGYGERKIYYTILISCKRAIELIGEAYLRPYIQAFYYKENTDNYGVDYIGEELNGVKDAGASDYIFWNNLSEYVILLKGSRKYFEGITGPLPQAIIDMIPTKLSWSQITEANAQ